MAASVVPAHPFSANSATAASSTSALVRAACCWRRVDRYPGPYRWTRRSEIVEFDPPRAISWRTIPTRLYRDSTRWTLRVEPAGDGTRLAQEYEILRLNPVLDRFLYLAIPAHRDRSAALRADLLRIGELAAQRLRR